jgi:heat shock protein HtpX
MPDAPKICPRCGYEKNRASALMCGLCGNVFPNAENKTPPSAAQPTLQHYRKDFAKEIADNRLGSISLLIGIPLLIIMLGFAFDVWFGITPWGMVGAAIIAVIIVFAAYYEGDHTILELSNAREADSEVDRQLINVVDEMRIAAGLPMPRVYVIDTKAANAFATGRDPEHATVVVTRGLVDALNREELQGVIGHEMSHVRNFDIRYMMLVAALVGSVVLLVDGFWRGGRFTLFSRRSRNLGPAGGIIAIVALVFILLSPLFAKLLQMAISRKREFLADASSVELTRNPLALASALDKLDQQAVLEPFEFANRATQHLYIVNPLRGFTMESGALFSTHPPTEARIKVLRSMA